MINYVGAKAVPVPLRKEFGFRLDAGELADSINDRTKLIILNSPQNPPRRRAGKKKWFGCSPLRPEIHSHSVRAGLGASFTYLIREATLASSAGGVVIQTIVRRCRDHNSIAVDVDVG